MSNKDEQLRQALPRLRGAYFQVVARHRESEALHFVAPPTLDSYSSVILDTHRIPAGKVPKVEVRTDWDSIRFSEYDHSENFENPAVGRKRVSTERKVR